MKVMPSYFDILGRLFFSGFQNSLVSNKYILRATKNDLKSWLNLKMIDDITKKQFKVYKYQKIINSNQIFRHKKLWF